MRGLAPKAVIKPAKGGQPNEYEIKGEDLAKIIKVPTEEQKKYIKCWEVDDYRTVSPGESLMPLFLETAQPNDGVTVVDWGCGTGRAGFKLYQEGLDVTLVDFAFNCLDANVKEAAKDNERLRFIEHDLSEPIILKSEFGVCCDVMEHIPEEQVDAVLDTIIDNSKHVFFNISTQHDVMGDHPEIDDDLHLTIKDYFWWLQKFLEKRCIVHHSNDLGGAVIFYVTGWGSSPLTWDDGKVNITDEQAIEHMRENATLGLAQVQPHEQRDETNSAPEDIEIMMLCGGPSLNDFEDEIRANREAGMKCVTMNGTYKWALDRDLGPVTQLVIDGRDFNERFVEPVREDCLYLVSSMCHPNLVRKLPKERTMLWQVGISDELVPEIKKHYGKMYEDWWPCPGGSTVALRGLCLLRMLGFNRIHVYGLDSCYREAQHHAYDQPENDKHVTMEITVGEGTKYAKTFHCAKWQVYQAREFQLMVPRVLKDAQLNIRGDGLIAYMVNCNADLAESQQ
jgi:SAM-dependent methyltransferase